MPIPWVNKREIEYFSKNVVSGKKEYFDLKDDVLTKIGLKQVFIIAQEFDHEAS